MTEKKTTEQTKAIKGFNADLKCRDHQFEVGQTYEVAGTAVACSHGFHACPNSPLDVWRYYGPIDGDGKLSRYADVSFTGQTSNGGDKIAGVRITIDAELNLPAFIRRAVEWIMSSAETKNKASGYSAKLAASGDYAKLAASGNSAQLAASGYSAQLAASGKNSVIASSSHFATATGAQGTWISLACYDNNGKCTGFSVGCVGQDGILPDVAYKAVDNKLVLA